MHTANPPATSPSAHLAITVDTWSFQRHLLDTLELGMLLAAPTLDDPRLIDAAMRSFLFALPDALTTDVDEHIRQTVPVMTSAKKGATITDSISQLPAGLSQMHWSDAFSVLQCVKELWEEHSINGTATQRLAEEAARISNDSQTKVPTAYIVSLLYGLLKQYKQKDCSLAS